MGHMSGFAGSHREAQILYSWTRVHLLEDMRRPIDITAV